MIPNALMSLVRMALSVRGRGIEQSPEGDPWPLFLRGRALERLPRLFRHPARAFECYLAAAQEERGLPVAMTMVGLAYRQGNGVLRDPMAARAWLEAAARDDRDPGAVVLLKNLNTP